MIPSKKQIILLACTFCFAFSNYAQNKELDIIAYQVNIEPKIQEKFIRGEVVLTFKNISSTNTIKLDAGDLEIEKVEGRHVRTFKKNGSKLDILFSTNTQEIQEITIHYHGSPKRGLIFNPEKGQAHTVYFTSHWMICNNDPSDKASLGLNILVPKGKQCIASGELSGTTEKEDKTLYHWVQNYETPAYTFGFVIGELSLVKEQINEVELNYYAFGLGKNKLKKVFEETPDILQFFEQKTGIPYGQKVYSQVLIGENYQEMSGFAVFNTSYTTAVLKDSSEIHLTAHELAHQWWGNRITCKSFDHFWLNEAFAVYMATAFNEERFGREKYLSDIALYKEIYDGLLKRNKDKALVFQNWQATRDNRHVVYYKGAYVLHLLRKHLGDKAFWQGIRLYSQRYYGKSVETKDFQQAMEEATNTNLDDFFEEWVYN